MNPPLVVESENTGAFVPTELSIDKSNAQQVSDSSSTGGAATTSAVATTSATATATTSATAATSATTTATTTATTSTTATSSGNVKGSVHPEQNEVRRTSILYNTIMLTGRVARVYVYV